jgi:hypothetical protein
MQLLNQAACTIQCNTATSSKPFTHQKSRIIAAFLYLKHLLPKVNPYSCKRSYGYG